MQFAPTLPSSQYVLLFIAKYLWRSVLADGSYWTDHLPNITEPAGGSFNHQVNMYLILDDDVHPPWAVGPLINCECFVSGQVSVFRV